MPFVLLLLNNPFSECILFFHLSLNCMYRGPCPVIALLLMSGCTTRHIDNKTDNYETSVAQCSEKGNMLYCDWQHVTDDWFNASDDSLKEKTNETSRKVS